MLVSSCSFHFCFLFFFYLPPANIFSYYLLVAPIKNLVEGLRFVKLGLICQLHSFKCKCFSYLHECMQNVH